jgi:hypothetical protein
MYSRADAEDSAADRAYVDSGAAVAGLLIGIQDFIGARVFTCQSFAGDISANLETLAPRVNAEGLTVSTSAQLVSGAAADNLSVLKPFNGSVEGDLDLKVKVVSSGGSISTGVLIERTETHDVHLPVELQAMVSDCIGAVSSVMKSAAETTLTNCTSRSVEAWASAASFAPKALAVADGFAFRMVVLAVQPSPCSASFAVDLQQRMIQGMTGYFSVELEETGNATFSQEPAGQQA